jgi:hypothetical protein
VAAHCCGNTKKLDVYQGHTSCCAAESSHNLVLIVHAGRQGKHTSHISTELSAADVLALGDHLLLLIALADV